MDFLELYLKFILICNLGKFSLNFCACYLVYLIYRVADNPQYVRCDGIFPVLEGMCFGEEEMSRQLGFSRERGLMWAGTIGWEEMV